MEAIHLRILFELLLFASCGLKSVSFWRMRFGPRQRNYFALPTSFSTSFISLGTALDKISGGPSVIRIVSSTR